ncbi:MAG: hypothetical protein WCK65_02780 [Rhodospirillaceae bacterium]
MKISIFLSYPRPHTNKQLLFVEKVIEYLDSRGFFPRTLGVTDYDMNAPLKAIRRLMLESNGLITIAFRRTFVQQSCVRYEADISKTEAEPASEYWITSPYCQIEPAMAYQIGLPTLIFREKGVLQEGVLEKGVVGQFMPEFDLDAIDDYLKSQEWSDVVGRWEGYVRAVVDKKGNPPALF